MNSMVQKNKWITKSADYLLFSLFFLEAAKWALTAFIGRQVAQIIYLSVVLILVLIFFLRTRFSTASWGQTFPKYLRLTTLTPGLMLLLYISLVIVSLLRSLPNYPVLEIIGRIITIISLSLACWIIGESYTSRERLPRLWNLFTGGLGLYVLLNILGRLFGISNAYTQTTQIAESQSGLLTANPIFFPFNPNHQYFSFEAGLLLVFSIIQLRHTGKNWRLRAIYLIFVLCGIFGLLAANVRTPFIAVSFTLLFALLWPLLWKHAAKLLVSIMVLTPLFFGSTLPIKLLESAEQVGVVSAGSQSLEELATLNNRHLIWKPVLEEFSTFKPIHIIGFGGFGQYSSGLTAHIARFWENPERITLHNVLLQQLVDLGYLGGLLFMWLFVFAINRFSRSYSTQAGYRRHPFNPGIAAIVYLTIASISEVVIYFPLISLLTLIYLLITYISIKDDSHGFQDAESR